MGFFWSKHDDNLNLTPHRNNTFKLHTKKKNNPNIEKMDEYLGPHSWLKSLYIDRSRQSLFSFDDIEKLEKYNQTRFKIDLSINESSVVVLSDSIVANTIDATHSGLIQYVFESWCRELGVVLTPDIIFYTIISEIKNAISCYPEKYQQLFASNNDPINDDNLTIDSLVNQLKKNMPCPELHELITSISFTTSPAHYKQVLGIVLADMACPYYDYAKPMCCIPKVAILGSEKDWQKIITCSQDIKNILSSYSTVLITYLDRVIKIINKIIAARFQKKDTSFLKKMFIYNKDKLACVSGHDDIKLDGWIKHLYFINDENYIKNYPSHFNCIPYTNSKNSKNHHYFFYACGLSSKIDKGFLKPEYNIAQCEIIDPHKKHIFDTISLRNL